MTGIKFKIQPLLLLSTAIITIMVIAVLVYSPFDKAISAIEQRDYDKAIKITSVGAKIYPYSKWYSIRAYAKFQKRDFEGAIKDYDKAYSLENDDYKIINFDNKIYVKYYLKEFDSALKDFDSEIENAKDDYIKDSFLWDKAQFLFNLGRYDDALKIYNSLLLKSDEDKIYLLKTRLYFERAQIYEKLGLKELAKKDLEDSRNAEIGESFENPIPAPALLLEHEI